MRILCIGISHKTAPVSLRERMMFDHSQMGVALSHLGRRWKECEFLALSTCNRTELYAARPVHGHPREQELHQALCEMHAVPLHEYEACMYTLADEEAARHLFTVAAGLDSMVPGEVQITSQIKHAYAAAVEAGTARAVMNDLFQCALHVAKHARSETEIAAGKVSVASVAVDCVAELFGTLEGRCVLSVGAGRMNELMLKHIARLRPQRLMVTNRSPARAQQLARAHGGEAVAFGRLGEHLGECDVLLTSTAAKEPILTHVMVEAAMKHRPHRPLLIVDIAVPRDVEETVRRLKHVHLYNIDDLKGVIARTMESRGVHQAGAKKIIDLHVQEFMDAFRVRGVAPAIDSLYRRMKDIADEELAEARRKFSTHDDAEQDALILQRALHRTIRRILHPAATNLRRSAATGDARADIAAIRKLFELEGPQ
jgi:glutamyl-tRNA reductase